MPHRYHAFEIRLQPVLLDGLSIPAFSVAKWVNTMTISRTGTVAVSSQPEWISHMRNWLPTSSTATVEYPRPTITTDVERSNQGTTTGSPRTRKHLSDNSQFTSRSPTPPTIHGQERELSAPPLKTVAFAATEGGTATYVIPHSGRGSREASRSPSLSLEQETAAQRGNVTQHTSQKSHSEVNNNVSPSGLVSFAFFGVADVPTAIASSPQIGTADAQQAE